MPVWAPQGEQAAPHLPPGSLHVAADALRCALVACLACLACLAGCSRHAAGAKWWCTRWPARRRHAPHLLAIATEVKHCCHSLAAVLRDNAPVGPALTQLEQMEAAFWTLQRAVGTTATTAAASTEDLAAPGEGAVQEVVSSASLSTGGSGASLAAAGAADLGGAEVAQDSLALHLALSMLFTCCTRVRMQPRRGHGCRAFPK